MYPTVYWGELLHDLRVQHYMLQKEVAALLHMSRQSYSNLETGRSQPTPEQLSALSFIYNVNLLDYVRKCIPPSYVAEQMAYRTLQARRVCEAELEIEEMKKETAKSNPRSDTTRHAEGQGSDLKAEFPGSSGTAISPLNEDTPVPRKRKREQAVQFHNTSGMSSIDLLMSKKYPATTQLDKKVFTDAFTGKAEDNTPKERKRASRKKNGSMPEISDKEPETAGVSPAVNAPSSYLKNDAEPEKEGRGPMPPELLKELFPPESPYSDS